MSILVNRTELYLVMVESGTECPVYLPKYFDQSFFIHTMPQRELRLGTRVYLEGPTTLFHISLDPDLSGNRPIIRPGENLTRQLIRAIRNQIHIQHEITSCPIAFPFHLSNADDLLLNLKSGQRTDLASSITTMFHHKDFVFPIMDKRTIEVHTHRNRISLPLFKIHKILPQPILAACKQEENTYK